jgi:hypothetical protein
MLARQRHRAVVISLLNGGNRGALVLAQGFGGAE